MQCCNEIAVKTLHFLATLPFGVISRFICLPLHPKQTNIHHPTQTPMNRSIKFLLATAFIALTSSFTPISNSHSECCEHAIEKTYDAHINAQGYTVYYAPYSGERYHRTSNCSGLRRARSIASTSKEDAVSKGLTPCGICYK